jgi:hypothetical protein
MNNIQKRFILFLFGCILIRSILVLIAKEKTEYLELMGYLAIIPAIGFSYIYLSDIRKTGDEVFGDKIWWNNLRPIHALLYLSFSIMAINKNKNAWILLLFDVIIGLFSFLLFHYNENNFSKLIQN